MATPATREETSTVAGISAATMKRFADMAGAMPIAEGDGAERILLQILNATSVEDTNEIWSDLADAERLVGEELLITAAKRMESDYKDGLGLYLLVEAVKTKTGEQIMFATGSTSVVAQLVVAYFRAELPFKAKLVRSDEPTKDGYYPQHLVVTKGTTGGKGSDGR